MNTISDWEEFDPDLLSSYIEKLSLEPTIPDVTNSLDILKDESLKNDPNINNNENLEDKHLLIKGKLQKENEEESLGKSVSKEETIAFPSNEEKEPILERNEIQFEVSNIIKCESCSSSDYDSDDSDSILTRGKEKTKRKSSRNKQYDRSTRTVNLSELNQHSLQFLASGYIVQDNTVEKWQPQSQFVSNSLLPAQSVQIFKPDGFTDCSIYSPLNVSSPESGYDTQTSEVLSPSPPNILPILNESTIEEEKELQFITDSILELEESLNKIETHQLEASLPGLDDFEYNDYIEQLKLFFKESDNVNDSNRIESEHNFYLEDGESSRSEIPDFIPLENLLDDYETLSNPNSTSTNISVSELEYVQSPRNAHKTAVSASYSSVKPNKRKIDFKLKDIAKHHVRFSENFDKTKYLNELKKVLEEIRGKRQCIDLEEQTENSKQTNLHNAVLNSNIERIYCLVEIQKKLFDSIQFEINSRDVFEKTALDYAEELKLPLIVDYLKENLAVKSV